MDIDTYKIRRETLNHELLNHPLFSAIKTRPDLQTFMEFHVFAVWDFMSLIKSLQLKLTGTSLPWMPPKDPASARLINEIVLAEESDEDGEGAHASHFEMYLAAMDDIGAATAPVRRFLNLLVDGHSPSQALIRADIHPAIKTFVEKTLAVATEGSTEDLMGFFFYGREEMIPELFEQLLRDWSVDPKDAPRLHYYLNRHIEIDRDEHGPAAEQLMQRWIKDHPSAADKIQRAGCDAIAARIALWDGVYELMG